LSSDVFFYVSCGSENETLLYISRCTAFKPCLLEIFGNIILAIPFGVGINFLTRIKPEKFLWLAFALGFGFEFSQLIISIIFRSGFRTANVNDLLNATGIFLGYGLFKVFAWAYLKLAKRFDIKNKWLLGDIYNIALQTQNK
jgi:glycopeptide antibiotics resistance protein